MELESIPDVPLLAGIEPEHLATLTRGALFNRYPPRTELFEEGELPDFLHVLAEGAVELSARGPGGKQATIEILEPSECFILAAVLTDAPYLMSARVVRPSRILLLPAPAIRRLIADDPVFSRRIIANLAAQFRRMVREVKSLKLRGSAQRLGCYLLALADEQGAGRTVTLAYEKRLLASRLGMTSENLSRTFAVLAEHGVRVQGPRVHIDAPARLRAFCRPDPLLDGRQDIVEMPL
jgi:CRP/FNR family transcriptional regulator, transcriptional activator FtrB